MCPETVRVLAKFASLLRKIELELRKISAHMYFRDTYFYICSFFKTI